MDWYTILKISTIPIEWEKLLSFQNKEEAKRKIKQLRDEDRLHSKDRPAEGKAYKLEEKDGNFVILTHSRPTITQFTTKNPTPEKPLGRGRMSGSAKGKWKDPDSKSPKRVYEDDTRDVKIGMRNWQRKLRTDPDIAVQDQKVTPHKDNPDKPSPHEGSRPNAVGMERTPVITGKDNDFYEALAATVGHEWIHYLTQEEYNPMREEIAATVADMVKRGAWDENTVREATKDFAAINFWVEMVARVDDPVQQQQFMERTYNQYARKVANYLVRYTLEKVTGKNMKPYLRDLAEEKIDETLNDWNGENKKIYSKQIHQIRDIAYDDQLLEFARLIKKYRTILKKPQGERKKRDRKGVPKKWRLSRWGE